MKNKKLARIQRRKRRVRSKVRGSRSRPRLSVFRSNRNIYAQVIDDTKGETVVAAEEKELTADKSSKVTKTEKGKLLGILLAKKCAKHKITRVVFDRNGYKYHGRVKALAEGLRSGGLIF